MENKNKKEFLKINENIDAKEVRVISSLGENLGVMAIEAALSLAKGEGFDLVRVSEDAVEPIVVKIMNFKKKLYEDKKKHSQSKKKQHEVQTKELRVTPKIGDHDLTVKTKKAIQFLTNGSRVKFVLQLKGRERSLKETMGNDVIRRITETLSYSMKEGNKNLSYEDESDGPYGMIRIFYLKK
jgi:translation initiation factor IF-3